MEVVRMLTNVQTENIQNVVRERIKEFIERLKQFPEVEGIVCLGGMVNTGYRDFVDKYSDIDISIFLNCDRNHLPDWLPTFAWEIPIELPNGRTQLIEVNLYQQIIDEEERCEWDDAKKEAYAYSSEVVFDRNDRIQALINEKTPMTPEYRKLLLAHILARIDWNVIENPLREMERGFVQDGHILLNQGIENLVELVYTYNGKYKPHSKWAIAMTDSLPELPKDFKERLSKAMKIEEITAKDLYRRRKVLLGLVQEIEDKIKEEHIFDQDIDYEGYFYYESAHWPNDRQIKTKTRADEILEDAKYKNLSKFEKKVLRGLISEYFITDAKQIENIRTNQPLYKEIIHNIQQIENIKNDEGRDI